MKNQTNAKQDDHDYVWELLPWYANERLSPQEANAVKDHLKNCPVCQSELTRCLNLNASVKTNRRETWQPTPAHFAKVLANVDALDVKRKAPSDKWAWLTGIFPWFADTPRPARFTLAMQGALVVALASMLMFRALMPMQGYQTLSQPKATLTASAPHLRLVFSEDITEREMRALLLDIHGTLVEGPSSMGVYTVALMSGDMPAVDPVLTRLRANPKVRLAEAVTTRSEE